MGISIIGTISLVLLAAETGPRPTDEQFFGALELSHPEAVVVRTAVAATDWPAARVAYATWFRTRSNP